MKLTILGSGAALPDPARMHSAYLITTQKGRNYLIDCGHGATHRLVEASVDPAEVGTIFLTHLHHDHVSDLAYFLTASWMCNRKGRPTTIGPKGTREMVSHLMEGGAFKVDIAARSQYLRRQENIDAVRPEIVEIAGPGTIFSGSGLEVKAARAIHIPEEITDCFGFRFEADGKALVFSSDTAPSEDIVALAKGADVLVHDCTFPEAAIEFRKKANIGTWAHTSPADLGVIARRAEAKCVIATHIAHYDNLNPVVRKYLSSHFPPDLIGPSLLDTVVEDIA